MSNEELDKKTRDIASIIWLNGRECIDNSDLGNDKLIKGLLRDLLMSIPVEEIHRSTSDMYRQGWNQHVAEIKAWRAEQLNKLGGE